MSRTVGPVPGVEGLGPGDHVCWIYDGDDEYRAGLSRYFSDGLLARQRLLYLADRYDDAAVEATLTAAGLAPRRLIQEGRLRIIPAREGYPTGSAGYDLDRAVVEFRCLADDAVADGYAGLRVAGECGFLLGDDPGRIPFLAYELACDMMVRDAPLTAMCLFDARLDPPDRLGEIAAVHAAAIVASSAASSVPTFHIWSEDADAVALGGEIDFATSQTVRDVLLSAAVGRAGVIDVSRVEFADVSAIRALARIAAEMAGPHDRPVIRGASNQIRFVAAEFAAGGLLFDG